MKKRLYRVTTISGSLNGLLKGQLKFLNNHYEVVGVASDTGDLKEVEEQQGIRTIDVRMAREISFKQDIRSLWVLYKLFRNDKPDIVHANTPKASLLSMIAAWTARIPRRIYLVTGLRFETTKGMLRFVLKTMERITCLCATKVIPEGEGVKNTLIRERITRKPLHIIHHGNINGIDLSHFDRTEEVLTNALKIRQCNFFTFVFIGRMVKDKGINELVAAFEQLSKKYSNTRLLLVGRFEDNLDPVLPKTKLIIEQNNNIEFVGYQSDVRPFLVASDVLILPSYREGFPNVVIQAGAMGLPSIVTDINGCNEIIVNNKNGLIIPKQDTGALYSAMETLYLNKDITEYMASNARELVASRYDQKDVWQATLEMYNSLN